MARSGGTVDDRPPLRPVRYLRSPVPRLTPALMSAARAPARRSGFHSDRPTDRGVHRVGDRGTGRWRQLVHDQQQDLPAAANGLPTVASTPRVEVAVRTSLTSDR